MANSTFKFKLLSQLSKKRDEGGFTLIELLVVVIIIGVLAAVALPNLLGQVGKARESEMKSVAGSANRSQQSFHFERQNFFNGPGNSGINLTDSTSIQASTAMSALGIAVNPEYITLLGISASNESAPSATDFAIVTVGNANYQADGTRPYSGGIEYNNGVYEQALCQADVATVSVAAPARADLTATDCGLGAGVASRLR